METDSIILNACRVRPHTELCPVKLKKWDTNECGVENEPSNETEIHFHE